MLTINLHYNLKHIPQLYVNLIYSFSIVRGQHHIWPATLLTRLQHSCFSVNIAK